MLSHGGGWFNRKRKFVIILRAAKMLETKVGYERLYMNQPDTI